MEKVLLNINENNFASIRLCEKFGGVLKDKIKTEENEILGRYWITL